MSDKMIIPRSKNEISDLEFKKIKMRVGIHKKTFVKNVVAIGLSAGFIEPLESNGLFSVHEFLFRLVDILQRGPINQFDRDMYNTEVKKVFDNFAKFVALHYALSHRSDTQYWIDCQDRDLSVLDGDPESIYFTRTDAFYNMCWRYMEEWGHPYKNDGIVYISTGMNLNMMNDRRIMSIEMAEGKSILPFVDNAVSIWEQRKNIWESNAASCDSLMEYLEKRFYNEKNI
jgi:hypothetical protein